MSPPHVSAVIVAWNSGDALGTCVDSLRDSADAAELDLQIVVVDNASEPEVAVGLRPRHGDIALRNPINAGYGVAAAQGLARAEAEWALLINPDVVVDSGFFEAFAGAMQTIPVDVASLVPELRYMSDRTIVNSRGIAIDEVGMPAEVDLGARAIERLAPHEVLGGSSGCWLLRCDAVRAVGGPEPVFFAYLEDVDLAIRLQRAGYRALFVPEAIAWHEGSASTGEGSPVKSFLVARNRRILFRLHGPRTLTARLWRLVFDTGHGVVASVLGDLGAPWSGRLDATRVRRYTEFLRRARREYDVQTGTLPIAPRARLRATFARKRTAARMTKG